MSHTLKIASVLGVALMVGVASFSAGRLAGEEKAVAPRIYELRVYTALEGRLPALHARFKDHTMKLFEKHGMQNVMYWTATDKPNTLIYVISHASREAATKSWDDFRKDPEWIKARDASEKDGKIVEKAESHYMTTTEYSPMMK